MSFVMTNKNVVRAMALAIQTPGLNVGSRKVPRTHGVRSGDTLAPMEAALAAVARAHLVSIAQLRKWNEIEGGSLQVGQQLFVSDPEKPEKIQVLGLPCLLWGPPGVAKTAFVNQITAVLHEIDPGWYPTPITVLASVREPADFLGLPLPEGGGFNTRQVKQPNGEYKIEPMTLADGTIVPPGGKIPAEVAMAPPDWARELNAIADDPGPAGLGKGRKAVLFLDEFTTAPPSVQAAMLRVVHERVVGDLRLHTNIAIIAAANPPWMSPGGEVLSPPTVNRFLHFDWKPPSKMAWAEYITNGTALSDEAKAKVKAEGKEWVARISGIDIPILNLREYNGWLLAIKAATARFMLAKPGELLGLKERTKALKKDRSSGKYDPRWDSYAPLFDMPRKAFFEKNRHEDFDPLRYAWPSPRSWDLALRAFAATKSTYSVMGIVAGPRAGQTAKLETGEDLGKLMVCAAVGFPLCQEYVTAVKRQDIHPPQEYVEGDRPFQKGNLDVTNTTLSGVINYGLENPEKMAAAVSWLERNSAAVRGHEGWSQNFFNSVIMKQYHLWKHDKGESLKRHNPAAYQEITKQIQLLRKRIEGTTKQAPSVPGWGGAQGSAPFDA